MVEAGIPDGAAATIVNGLAIAEIAGRSRSAVRSGLVRRPDRRQASPSAGGGCALRDHCVLRHNETGADSTRATMLMQSRHPCRSHYHRRRHTALRGRVDQLRGRRRCDHAVIMPTNHVAPYAHRKRRRHRQFRCAPTQVGGPGGGHPHGLHHLTRRPAPRAPLPVMMTLFR